MRYLFVLRGAPASGKSTWIKENELEPYTISTDSLRLMYQSPITTVEGDRAISQNHDKQVWELLMELLERRMENGELVVIDATHYKSSLINRYKELVSKYRYRVYVVDFSNVPEEELKRRNATRGFRKVPDEVIEKMVVALADTNEVKKQFKIVSPEEAITLINSPLEPFDANEYEKVVIFGDIHGCYDPLKEYFDKNPFNENYNYIFCGDYLDRGTQNKEVLEFLISLKDKKNCVFLEGNHEKWLRIYSQKDYDMEYYENRPNIYKDPFVTKLISQLRDRQTTLEKQINKNKNMSEELSKLLRESWETDPENREVFYRFEKINVPEKQKQLHHQIKVYETHLEILKKYSYALQHEEGNTMDTIYSCNNWFKETFNCSLSLDITNILERNYNVKSNRKQNPIRSLEFIKRTYPQIKDIDKTEIRRFCDRLAQMSYFTFNRTNFLVTHGGVPCMPTMKSQTIELIKGVGKYEDHDKIDFKFQSNSDGNTVSIHGHRNTMRSNVELYPGGLYNLEGQVEFGGHVRILEIATGADDCNDFNCIEIKNEIYDIPEVKEEEEKSDIELLKEMYDSKWVQVKNLKDNVISFNFTRDAFEKDKWNTITTKARGLFVDKTDGHIVGRSFDKFFNYHQHETTEPAYMKQHIKWPLIGYKKENGFLGIVSKDQNGVHFFTKSSDDGDYVNWFIGVLCDNYGITYLSNSRYSDIYNKLVNERDEIDKVNRRTELDILKIELTNKLSPLLDEGYSYVFECIDKDNDPHIIKYDTNKIFLLEVFKNQLKEEHVSYDELFNISCDLQVHLKKKELEFNNWEEFEEWKDKFRQGLSQWDCKHEGYVFEDQNGYRVKFKSSFYSFWKRMRALKDAIAGGRTNKKTYKTKEEIQVVKLMEELGRDKLKEMSIIDVEDMFYERYGDELSKV